MGEYADLKIEQMERGYSLVWLPDEKQVHNVCNMELMYGVSKGILLEECSLKQLQAIANTYGLLPKKTIKAAWHQIRNYFDP